MTASELDTLLAQLELTAPVTLEDVSAISDVIREHVAAGETWEVNCTDGLVVSVAVGAGSAMLRRELRARAAT